MTYSNYIDNNKVAIVCSARSGSTKALGTTNLLLRAASEALQRAKAGSTSVSGTTTPITRGLFGVGGASTNGNTSDHSPPRTPDSNYRGRSSSSPSPAPASVFGFTPLNDAQQPENVPDFHHTVDLIRQEHFTAARAAIQDPDILKELEEEIDRDCDWLRSFLYAAKVCLSSFTRLSFRCLTTVRPLRLLLFPSVVDLSNSKRSSMKYLLAQETTSSAWAKSWLASS